MRKLINSTYITLDGVIANPAWTSPYFDDEAAAFAGSQTEAADTLLMGRHMYDGFAAVWPKMDESDPNTGAAYFNNGGCWSASTPNDCIGFDTHMITETGMPRRLITTPARLNQAWSNQDIQLLPGALA